MTDRHDPKHIKTRISALATMARLDAANQGGDSANAAADLMCAFVLLARQNGADPSRAADVMLPHAIVACEDFYGERGPLQ